MKSILEKLYGGSIYPDEIIIPRNPDYISINQNISNTKDMWRNKLSEDDYKDFEELFDLQFQVNSMNSEASFMYGFKLGTLIMIEVMTGKEELIRGGD